jgi:hypothetical protein
VQACLLVLHKPRTRPGRSGCGSGVDRIDYGEEAFLYLPRVFWATRMDQSRLHRWFIEHRCVIQTPCRLDTNSGYYFILGSVGASKGLPFPNTVFLQGVNEHLTTFLQDLLHEVILPGTIASSIAASRNRRRITLRCNHVRVSLRLFGRVVLLVRAAITSTAAGGIRSRIARALVRAGLFGSPVSLVLVS